MSREFGGLGSMPEAGQRNLETQWRSIFRESRAVGNDRLSKPRRINLLEAVVLEGDVQPRIDKGLEGCISLQPTGFQRRVSAKEMVAAVRAVIGSGYRAWPL
jgi:hypothetical protein